MAHLSATYLSASLKKAAAGLLVASFANLAAAFHPLITDDTGTQGSGGNQIELAGTTVRDDGGTLREGAFVYTRGLTDDLDAFVELGRQRIDPSNGPHLAGKANPAVGAKWRFIENENKTSLAIKPVYVFALSEDDEMNGLGSGKPSYELSLILTQEMEWGAVHANLVSGRNRYRDAAISEDEWVRRFSVAPVRNIGEQWKLAADLGAEHLVTSSQKIRTRFGELGVIYSPRGDLDITLGLIRARDRDSRAFTKSATAGLTWRFN